MILINVKYVDKAENVDYNVIDNVDVNVVGYDAILCGDASMVFVTGMSCLNVIDSLNNC